MKHTIRRTQRPRPDATTTGPTQAPARNTAPAPARTPVRRNRHHRTNGRVTRQDIAQNAGRENGREVGQPANQPVNEPATREKPGLPLRWAVIGLAALLAGTVGYLFGGPIAAITTAAAVAVAAHRLLD
ncbi:MULTISPECIES: hypothetical protein [Micromonospora]|uniref:Uncharacterized protein n=1 Tax=Micromonospora solifontis TaxID=2487138 RepID=A0ABX9WN50_9ACTN|nr:MULTISPECIES: hypothetical protein [Micromonospora]NES14557.1 hypothetical protein [Micromonospora sp. PPF5-17B]NES35305.1 hypothetical protein [Micromonospora solifontis]RNM01030.1 hypothetical protein EFE23_03895 [Micromonospora solifontis]